MHLLLLSFDWHQLVKPEFYINLGGLWLLLFIVFAETGLFFGFFLPGDSLLFVAGIYNNLLVSTIVTTHSDVLSLIILWILISIMGILGNLVGYWFGRKSGPFLYERKDTWFFKKKYLHQAHEFYEEHGGAAIVYARFLPIVRTFAPIVAGVVKMERKHFFIYNVIGCVAWVFAMLFAGHYLNQFIWNQFHFDLKDHLELIVIGIVVITTAPVLIKLFSRKTKTVK
ncbi:MAG TPA: VTT domain-containing protein [Dinghuibacter sp.]|jgi:membrane-associated protein|uniref:DedA family protein n=1 Tax=Dinghuibacter sp. TaxID=2024697 RepID=UPI002C8A7085|nr:VTT domain-containing protein [Dinghuibacter sp.]HTJ11329.1 VTT domain-containing protein [Dinghuibacter sp.]